MVVRRLMLGCGGVAVAAMLAAGRAGEAAAPAPGVDAQAAALMAAAKAASGGAAWDKLTGVRETQAVVVGGLRGQSVSVVDVVGVREASHTELGPARLGQGFDGKAAWSTDSSGQVRVETSAASMAAAVESVYFDSFAFFFPGRWPAEMIYAGAREEGGQRFEAVRIVPQGANPVELWFDPATHLPARLKELSGAQPTTTLISGWRDWNGVKLPGKTIIRVGNDPKYDTVVTLAAVEAVQPADAEFAPPAPPAADFSFPAGKSAVTVPIRILNNHIYLPVSIDGKKPVDFIFDTGAVNYFDSSHAAALGVKIEGALPGGGFGDKVAKIGLARVGSVSIGGLTVKNQMFAAQDIGALLQVEGENLTGLVGYEFAKRAVVTIDYAQRTLTLTDPAAFHAPAGAVAVPFRFNAHAPMVEASIDGADGEFEIDTGARGALTLMRPFVTAHGLVAKYGAHVRATVGFGAGGTSEALLARGGMLRIGGVSVPAPVLYLSTDAAGAGAAADMAGNIGGAILRNFTLTLDYGHKLLYFEPASVAAGGVFDRSGLWLNRDGGALVIGAVTAGSAAAKAGLAPGMRIVAVNGRPAARWDLDAVRTLLQGQPGSVVRLTLLTGRRRRVVALHLADQV